MDKAIRSKDGKRLSVLCPGCERLHTVIIDGSRGWSFSGDLETPTINPSVLISWELDGKRVTECHSFIEQGQIRFLSDCRHGLANQKVDLPTVDKWTPDQLAVASK